MTHFCGRGFWVAGLAWLLALGGCATVPTDNFPYPTLSMNNVSYFALQPLCEKERIKWDYDPLEKVIILKKSPKEITLLIGSDQIMVGDVLQKIAAPVELRDSVVYAPVDAANYIVGPLCRIPARKKSTGGAYLRAIETIVVDAGHGGKDPGAIGRYGLKEKGVVLDVARNIQQELARCGLKVRLTRSSDDFIPLSERSLIANAGKADLFVSIHANANRARWMEGFEVYYLTESVDDDARALVAAENVSPEVGDSSFSRKSLSLLATLWDMIYTENRRESIELAKHIGDAVSKKMGLKMLGVKGAPFAVLKGAHMPAVLVEIGYISNREGEKKLRDPGYRRRMAEAIVEGILDFKNYSEGVN